MPDSVSSKMMATTQRHGVYFDFVYSKSFHGNYSATTVIEAQDSSPCFSEFQTNLYRVSLAGLGISDFLICTVARPLDAIHVTLRRDTEVLFVQATSQFVSQPPQLEV